jgi:feruloyl-CoA synthase
MARYRDAHVGGCVDATVDRRADGTVLLRSTTPLGEHPPRLTDHLEHWAREAPQRTFAARRQHDDNRGGDWRRVSYAEMLARVQSVGQALLDLGLSVERPLVILSGNDLEHLTLALGAMWAGIAHAPVSPAYSLVAQDFGKLRHIAETLTPGAVYAADASYARAIDAVFADLPVILGQGMLPGRRSLSFDALLDTAPGESLARAHAAVGPDTVAKFLFTSGSTKLPKAVPNTQRMLTANQQMLRQCMRFLADAPPVLVDWLPWNHTFGGNHNVGIVLTNGGTLYIDDGKPTPSGMAETLRNLREISPSVYFNVPKGFEEIARAMDHDDALRATLFRDVQAFMFAGAGLAQAVWDKLDAHAEAAIGERIRVITGLGMTETAPSCTFAVGTDVRAGWIGLPVPGVDVKLVPAGDKTEIRFRGPNVMTGYWRAPEETAAAFDDEGFYCTGDAVVGVDPADLSRGLMFDGRIAEDFKLSSGTFVSVGPLRAKVLALGAPMVQDSVVAGLNRDDIGLLVFPRLDDCRRLAGLPAGTEAPAVVRHPAVRNFFQQLADRLWREGTGGANRVARMHVLAEPPSLEAGELTDKGSINQRAVLKRRASLVDALYEDADPLVILPNRT